MFTFLVIKEITETAEKFGFTSGNITEVLQSVKELKLPTEILLSANKLAGRTGKATGMYLKGNLGLKDKICCAGHGLSATCAGISLVCQVGQYVVPRPLALGLFAGAQVFGSFSDSLDNKLTFSSIFT